MSQPTGDFWWSFGFDGVSAGDTRDSYPTDGAGGVGFVPVTPALEASQMRDSVRSVLEGLVVTNNSDGGNLIIKRASDGSVLQVVPCPVPSLQPDGIVLRLRCDTPGGFTIASDQPVQILTAIALYSFELE